MKKSEGEIFTIFKKVAAALATLPEEELRKLGDPLYSIEIKGLRSRVKEGLAVSDPDVETDAAILEIASMPSRQAAQDFLDRRFSSKRALEGMARKLDIPIVRQDKVDALRDKIVEATVGARIRSQAIQGVGGS